jgi:hypothetical protein
MERMQKGPFMGEFRVAIERAIADPDGADLRELLVKLERALLELPQEQQLQVAGSILAQLVEVFAVRAERMLDAWDEKYCPFQEEPVLTTEMLQEVLRQTMALDLAPVIGAPLTHAAQPNSVVGTVEKTNLLEFLNQMEAEKQQALDVAHDEDVNAWVAAIAHWKQTYPKREVSLSELQRALKMPLIKIWLALLLGGFRLEQRGNFYEIDGVWISGL